MCVCVRARVCVYIYIYIYIYISVYAVFKIADWKDNFIFSFFVPPHTHMLNYKIILINFLSSLYCWKFEEIVQFFSGHFQPLF